MKLGISAAGGGPPLTDFASAVDRIVAAEKDGFESVWLNSGAFGEPMTLFAIAGRETQSIHFRTGIAVTYTRHPALMAQQAMTTSAATGGRFTLGLGPSHRPAMERLGIDYDRAAQHVREYLTVLRGLIEDGRVRFQGDFYRVDSTLQLPYAAPKCPVIVAALAPRMLKIAGELADGTVTWMAGVKTLATHIGPRIREAAANAGRPQPLVCAGLPVCVWDDQEAARRRADELYASYANLTNYKRLLDIEGKSPGAIVVCGTESEVESQLRDLAAAGVDEFYANPFTLGDNPAASYRRTREFLKTLVGKL